MAEETENNVWPLPRFYFSLNIDGKDHPFQEVSGLAFKTNTEEISEGGENRFINFVPNVTKYTNLVVKRGLVKVNSQLATWCLQTVGSDLSAHIVPKNITLSLMDTNAKPLQTWDIINAWPVKWDTSDLKSMEGEIVIETLEFAFSYFKIKN